MQSKGFSMFNIYKGKLNAYIVLLLQHMLFHSVRTIFQKKRFIKNPIVFTLRLYPFFKCMCCCLADGYLSVHVV